jgi:tetratricopeptide (TPR) repeat protein
LVGLSRTTAGTVLHTWDARPLPPEVEGRQRLYALAEELPTKAEIVERLNADRQLSAVARRAALDLVANVVEDHSRLNSLSWAIAWRADRTPEEYCRALHWAQTAVQLKPQYGAYLNTLGTAQYRLGQYREALASIQQAEKLQKRVEDALLLAMIHHRLGNRAEAVRQLERARQWNQGKAFGGADARALFAEAEALIQAPKR